MGLIDELIGLRVCIDTAPFIYFIHEVSELASKLRAKYSIRTPDALQIVTEVLYGATTFLTNDPDLKKVSDIKVIVLDDFLEK